MRAVGQTAGLRAGGLAGGGFVSRENVSQTVFEHGRNSALVRVLRLAGFAVSDLRLLRNAGGARASEGTEGSVAVVSGLGKMEISGRVGRIPD